MASSTKPHAILVASPGMGHVIPMMELANQLAANHGFQVTIFTVTMESTSKNSIHFSTNSSFYDLIVLPYVDSLAHLIPANKIMTRLVVTMRAYIPILQAQLESMDHIPSLLIVDYFGTEFLKLAHGQFNTMTKYVFMTSNAWFLAETLYVPLLDKHVKQNGPLSIPGCKPIHYDDILDPVIDPYDREYDELVRIGCEIGESDGVLVNTWEDLESKTVFALRNNVTLKKVFDKPVYPVGPLVRSARPECNLGGDLMNWLNDQPKESVIYVSFGSGGTLTSEQIIELAWGLEQSEQRFVWIFRPPSEDDPAGALFYSMDEHDPIKQYLPDGFLTRTHHIGRIIPTWAPQSEILAHPNVGAFISHCGWNSILESLSNGVPMIAWPLYAEQKMNATLLEEEIGVALRPSKVMSNKGLTRREEIERIVRIVMDSDQGRHLRHRAKEVQRHARKALKTMTGSSSKSLALSTNHILQSSEEVKRLIATPCI